MNEKKEVDSKQRSSNQELYDKTYFDTSCGTPYTRENFIPFFRKIASNIKEKINPASVIDVGCAKGFLVECLRDLSIDAYGFDISNYALSEVRDDLKKYCVHKSILEKPQKKYDLAVCIEILEHLKPELAEKAVKNLCTYSDDILFSSTPSDKDEKTHYNVQPHEYWIELFAQNNFYRDLDFDCSFITPYAIRLRKTPDRIERVIKNFEQKLWQQREQIQKLEESLKTSTIKIYENETNPLDSLMKIYKNRTDLQQEFPAVTNSDYTKLLSWAITIAPDKIGNTMETHLLLKHRNFYMQELDKIRNADLIKQKDTLLEQQTSQLKQKDTLLEQQTSQLGNVLGEARQHERIIAELEITKENQGNKIDNLVERLQNSTTKESLLANELNSIYNSVLFNLSKRIAASLDKTCPPNTLLGKALRKTAYRFYGKEINTPISTIMSTEEFSYGYGFDDFVDEKTQTTMIESFDAKPTVSIIMPVYNTDPFLLKKAILSVKRQYYPNWQLCICDDGSSNNEIHQILKKESSADDRILVTYSHKNEGISSASNNALNLATGEYTLLLDHDDELATNALLEVVNAINKDKNVDFIYSDEDKIDQKGIHIDPFFKPDWSPDLLFSYNYTIHVSVYRTSVLKQIGGFRNGFEGSQDYDLNLRYLEHARKIVHISKVLYSWRKTPGSTALGLSEKNYAFEAGKKAITETLQRRKIDAKCQEGIQPGTYSVKYSMKESPLITIIIPTRTLSNLQKCVKSIVEKSTYKNVEILVMDSSKDSQIKKFCENIPKVKCESVHMEKFNFSKVNNDAVQKSNGKYVIFLNDDTEVIAPKWIEGLLEHAQRDEIGIVGAKLLYPDGRIQHAGTVIGIQYHGGNYGGMYENDDGYFSYPKIVRDCCAVTAACMMMKKDFFNKIGGYDEKLAKAWQDVDLCIRVIRSNKLIIYTPYSVLYHYEGGTRGSVDISGEELEARRLFREKNFDFIERGDPYYNPNLSLAIPFRVVKNYIKPIRVLADLYELRSDLRQTFPNEQKNNFKTLIDWAATSGILTDSRKDVLQKHYDFYFENSSKEAKPLAMIVKQYMENKELQKKFPEAATGNLDSLIKFMNKN